MSDVKEFKNNTMTVSVMEEPGCLVKLDITVTPEAAKASYFKAIKAVNKEVTIPGFRKGRAPEDLILSHYQKHVDEEWGDLVLNTAFSEALTLTGKTPYNKNMIKQPHVKTLSKEDGAKFTIEFEAHPEIPELVPSDFTIANVSKKEVKNSDVVDFIENMRLRVATWNDVEGRGVEDGDYVDLDIESLDEPGLKICENTRFEVSDRTARWMHKLLMGATAGSTVEGVSEKDQKEESCTSCGTEGHEHHHHHDDEFKPTRCRITINAVKRPILPELDEEFAKKVSAENLDHLNENAKKKLEKDAESEKNDLIKEDLKKQIQEKYQFEIPRSFLTSGRPDEKSQLCLFFLANEFAKKHNITVSNNEVYQAAMHEVMTQGELAEDLMHGEERRVDAARSILYTNMLIEKVLNKLLELTTENSSK